MAEVVERPVKRMRTSPQMTDTFEANGDFIALGQDDTQRTKIAGATSSPHHGSRDLTQQRSTPRQRLDRPRSKHALPGHEPWILVLTKLGRRFVHNTKTKESLWRVPHHLHPGIAAHDELSEKKSNAEWAEEQLRQMRSQQASKDVNNQDPDRQRRRRSESLQREDEAAMLAELARDLAPAISTDTTQPAAAAARGYLGDASDSEYEYIEITDTEGEGDEDGSADDVQADEQEIMNDTSNGSGHESPHAPAELGEDDMAYQLAMMGESYGLDPDEYGALEDEQEQSIDGEDQAMTVSTVEATALFNQMLEEHGISPFTPWDTIIADTSPTSLVFDGRYTLLPSSKARKEAWDAWSREHAAQIQAERAQQDKQDPYVAYLSFLSRHASTKLYWPEFRRKFKREPELNSRALQDKDRERLYREYVAKLKLPESRRIDELKVLLKSLPQQGGAAALPTKICHNAVLYTVPLGTREQLLCSAGYSSDVP